MIKYHARWTKEELAYLAYNEGKLPQRYLARVLNRTPQAVRMQIFLLKKQKNICA